MRTLGSVVYWFCSAVAAFLVLFGEWYALSEHVRSGSILIFCLALAFVFYLAGTLSRRMWDRRGRLRCLKDPKARRRLLCKTSATGKSLSKRLSAY